MSQDITFSVGINTNSSDRAMDKYGIEEIKKLAASLVRLREEAYHIYLPIVEELCAKQASLNEVEQCLDHLLDFACHEKMLRLFKRLCRHYYPLYPESITDYIMFYKEMWDTPENESSGNENEASP